MLAALEGHEAIVKFLINQGANVNDRNVSGQVLISSKISKEIKIKKCKIFIYFLNIYI